MKSVLSEDQLTKGVKALAKDVSRLYGNSPLTIIGVLTGSLVFLADLMRLLEMPLRVGVVQARSYKGTTRGSITINSELMPDICEHDVLLVDDIFDTGHTLEHVIEQMRVLRPRSLRSAVLLRKLGRQEVTTEPDFTAFEIPNQFVVGYGLDYDDKFRNLPYLAALEPDDIQAASV